MARLGVRPISFAALLLLLVPLACESAGGAGSGSEKGVWCRQLASGAAATPPGVKLLFLDGDGSYWVFDGTTPTVFADRYEMVQEDGDWYWHSWIGEAEYGNRVERLEPGRQLVLWDKGNERPVYYYYQQDFAGAYDYQIQFVEAYGITEEMTCEQR